ncbi:hypothetical protein BH09BAC2_BH09BAC2_11940 [soil metagenome]
MNVLKIFCCFLFCGFALTSLAQQTSIIKAKAPAKAKDIVIKYGIASYYAKKFNGRETTDGSIYDEKLLTAACNVLPLGTWVKVTNLKNNRSVIVKINDRMHHLNKRLIDLTFEAAKRLKYTGDGITRVKVEVLGKLKKRNVQS